eukprot:251828_1
MAVSFECWSVDDVKRWVNTWTSHHYITPTTISNVKRAAEIYQIDGQSLIYFTPENLKQFGLNKKDINIALKRIDALVLHTYLDYMIESRYKCKSHSKKHSYRRNYQEPEVKENILIETDSDEWESLQDSNNYPIDKRAQKTPLKQRIKPKQYIRKRRDKKATMRLNNNKYNYKIQQSISIDNSNENKEALQAIANNKDVQYATKSAMNDRNIRNAAMNVYINGGNDNKNNRKLVGALAKNKQVQGAAISVAKDKRVQKAAYKNAKKHATMKNVKKVKRGLLSFK